MVKDSTLVNLLFPLFFYCSGTEKISISSFQNSKPFKENLEGWTNSKSGQIVMVNALWKFISVVGRKSVDDKAVNEVYRDFEKKFEVLGKEISLEVELCNIWTKHSFQIEQNSSGSRRTCQKLSRFLLIVWN